MFFFSLSLCEARHCCCLLLLLLMPPPLIVPLLFSLNFQCNDRI